MNVPLAPAPAQTLSPPPRWHAVALRPIVLAALLLLVLPGCSGRYGLVSYTAAGQDTPPGYHYPSVTAAAAGSDALAGMQTNPGSLDLALAGVDPVLPGSPINATEGYAAYLESDTNATHYIVSVALRLSRPFNTTEVAMFGSLCNDEARYGAFLEHDDVLAFVTWSNDTESRGAGGRIAQAIEAETGATAFC